MHRIATILLILLVSGCASIPISTMLKLSSFDEDSFLLLEGEQVRAQVAVSQPYTINFDKTKLTLDTETDLGTRHFAFPLTLLSETEIPEEIGFFSSRKAQTQYTFKISDEGLTNFTELQRAIEEKQRAQSKAGFSFMVSAGFNEEPLPNEIIVVSINLQLSEEDGYFALIENAEIEVEE